MSDRFSVVYVVVFVLLSLFLSEVSSCLVLLAISVLSYWKYVYIVITKCEMTPNDITCLFDTAKTMILKEDAIKCAHSHSCMLVHLWTSNPNRPVRTIHTHGLNPIGVCTRGFNLLYKRHIEPSTHIELPQSRVQLLWLSETYRTLSSTNVIIKRARGRQMVNIEC